MTITSRTTVDPFSINNDCNVLIRRNTSCITKTTHTQQHGCCGTTEVLSNQIMRSHHVSADRLRDDAAAASFSLAGWGLKHRRRRRWHQHRWWKRWRGNWRWGRGRRGRRRTHPSTRTTARHWCPRRWWGRFQIRGDLTDDAEGKMDSDTVP